MSELPYSHPLRLIVPNLRLSFTMLRVERIRFCIELVFDALLLLLLLLLV